MLWTAHTNGTTEISELPNLQKNSKILEYNNGYYISNGNSLSYINNMKNMELNIDVDSEIETLALYEEYVTVTTKESLYLIKENEICEGFPINSDGLFNISDIDNDGKINLINIKNGSIYNYELTD
jgi:hypothetical protein